MKSDKYSGLEMIVGITGSEGYIGSRLMDHLAENGYDCIAYDKVRGEDILDERKLRRRFSEVDVVVHLAALSGVEDCERNPLEAIRNNVEGTISVAEFCKENETRLIFSSSFAIERNNIYGRTKKLASDYIRPICEDYLIFKTSNVYGGTKPTVINEFIGQNSRGIPLTVHSPGSQVRDFIHISDVVKAYEKAIESDYVGTLDLVSGEVTSIIEAAEMISDDIEMVDGPDRDEIFRLQTSTDGLRKIDYTPSISLQEGIRMEKGNHHENV